MALQKDQGRVATVCFDAKHQKLQKHNPSDSASRERQSCLPLTTVRALQPDTTLFMVPAGLVRIFDCGLVAAGIARRVEVSPGKWQIDTRDKHGHRRCSCPSALFSTLLSEGGVLPRTAQTAMHHSTIDLTMNVYTDPRLLDVAGAMKALPALLLSVQNGHDGGGCGLSSTHRNGKRDRRKN